MRNAQRWTASLLLVVFAGLAIWRILSMSYRPDMLYRAIPSSAVLAADHRDLARVWERHLGHPMLPAATEAFGVYGIGDLAADAGTRRLVRWLTGRLSVTAWSPPRVPGDAGWWAGTSWIGGPRATIYRLLLWMRYVPGLGRLRVSPHGTRYLVLDDGPNADVLAFAVADGVLLAAYGPDPDAIRKMQWRFWHGAPVARLFGDEIPWERNVAALHRMWLDESFYRSALPWLSRMRVDLHSLTPEGIILSMHAECPAAWRPPRDADALSLLAGRLPPESPVALVAVPGTLLRWSAQHGFALPDGRLEEHPPAWLMATLTTQPYEGRLMGLAAPGLFLRWPAPLPPSAAVIDAWLDRLNRQAPLGLIRRNDGHDADRFESLIDTSLLGRGIQGREDECAVLDWHDGVLTLGTSAGSLRRQHAASGARGEGAAWLAGGSGISAIFAAAWFDPGALSDALQNVLAVYRLAMLMGAVHEMHWALGPAYRVSEVLRAMAAYGPVRMLARLPADGRVEVSIRLGDPDAAP